MRWENVIREGNDEIRTARLRLVPFAERHLTQRYVCWLNDRNLMRFSEQRHRIHTLESCRCYVQSFVNTPNRFWAIEEEHELGHIGNISVYIDEKNGLADVSILIGEAAARGNGYGQEAWDAACRYTLSEVGMRKVIAGTMAGNLAMRAVMERSGMVPDGMHRRHYICEGREVDLIYMALFRDSMGGLGGRR